MSKLEGWPVARATDIELGNPISDVAIATLWTQREQLAPLIGPDNFHIIGQIYTTPGISYALRNLMANNVIRHLVVCGADLQKTGEALKKIWEGQINQDNQVIGLDKMGIDKELPRDAIERLTQRVNLHDLREWNIGRLKKELGGFVTSLPHLPPQGEPEVFPEAQFKTVNTFPSEEGVHVVRGRTVGQAWLRGINEVMMFGEEIATIYGEPSKDLTNLVTVVTEEDPKNPKYEDYFPLSKDQIDVYMDNFLSTKVPDGVPYTYGERLRAFPHHAQGSIEAYRDYVQNEFGLLLPESFDFEGMTLEMGGKRNVDQVEVMINKLKRTKYDRGAIAILYDPIRDNQTSVKDAQWKGFRNPCYVLVQAAVKKDRVALTAYSRSNDMGGAWIDNAYGFRTLQHHIAQEVELPMGPLITISSSAHLYEHDWGMAQRVVEENRSVVHGGFDPDPRSVFQIRVENDDIAVTHSDPETNQQLQPEISVKSSDRAAETLGIKLDKLGVLSQPGHGLYLGRELAFAQIASRLGIPYTQEDQVDLFKNLAEMAEKAKKYDQLSNS